MRRTYAVAGAMIALVVAVGPAQRCGLIQQQYDLDYRGLTDWTVRDLDLLSVGPLPGQARGNQQSKQQNHHEAPQIAPPVHSRAMKKASLSPCQPTVTPRATKSETTPRSVGRQTGSCHARPAAAFS